MSEQSIKATDTQIVYLNNQGAFNLYRFLDEAYVADMRAAMASIIDWAMFETEQEAGDEDNGRP